MRDHLFPFTRFAMHTLELVRRGCCITLQPSHAPVSPGSMVAMDCIMRQRVEQIHTLHAAALLFHDCFSSAQPGSSCSHHLLSSMHRRLQLHSSSLSCRSRATLVRFFRDCFMPVALQLEACLFATVGGATQQLLQLPEHTPCDAQQGQGEGEGEGQGEGDGEEQASLLMRWHRGCIGCDTSTVPLPSFMQPLAADIVAAGHASAVLIAEHSPCCSVVHVLGQGSDVCSSVSSTLDDYIQQLQQMGGGGGAPHLPQRCRVGEEEEEALVAALLLTRARLTTAALPSPWLWATA